MAGILLNFLTPTASACSSNIAHLPRALKWLWQITTFSISLSSLYFETRLVYARFWHCLRKHETTFVLIGVLVINIYHWKLVISNFYSCVRKTSLQPILRKTNTIAWFLIINIYHWKPVISIFYSCVRKTFVAANFAKKRVQFSSVNIQTEDVDKQFYENFTECLLALVSSKKTSKRANWAETHFLRCSMQRM